MKTIDLAREQLDVPSLLGLARHEPLLLLTADGEEFVLSEADDFDREVAALRASSTFQEFLDERSRSTGRTPLDEIEREIDREIDQTDTSPT